MKRAYILSGLIALGLAVNAGGAMARDGMGPRIDFEAADRNSDGKLTQEEIKAFAEARFAAADTDGDGALSVDEMAARMEARMRDNAKDHAQRGAARMIEHRDANDDGKLSFDEMSPKDGGAKMFSRLDADDDGAISTEEFAKMQERHAQMREHGKGGRHGDHKWGHKDGHHKDGEHGKRSWMKKAPAQEAPSEDAPAQSE